MKTMHRGLANSSRRWAGMRSGALVAFALLAAPREVRADWPMFRHDVSRTAAGTRDSDLLRPAITWRRYLGGSVGVDQMLSADVDGDGQFEVVFVSGGKLVAKRPDDSLLWETAPLALSRIDAIRDVDNDGTLDIVATGTPSLVAIFSGRDGHLEWRTRPDSFGPSIGAIRFARLDSDSLDDMYVADAACGSTGSLGDIAYAYSFAGGFGVGSETPGQRLWQLERGREYVCGSNDVVADLDNDGAPEVVTLATTHMYLYDGRTGMKLPSGVDPQGGYAYGFSMPYGTAVTDVTDVDGDGRLDIVGYTNNSYTPSINSRLVFVASYDPSRPADQRLYVRWFRNVADVATDVHSFVHTGAADLDGDHRAEITTTFTESGVTTTYVFDGATGAVRARIDGASVLGVVTLVAGENPIVLVRRAGMLEGYRLVADPSGDAGAATLSSVFAIPAASIVNYRSRERSRSRSTVYEPLTVPVTGASRSALVLSAGTSLQVWDVLATTPAMIATLPFPMGVSLVAMAPEDNVSRPGPGLLLARSDGFLLVLDPTLHVLNFGGDAEVPLPGIRTGGFYSGASSSGPVPVAGRFDRMANDVIAQDSRGVLLRLDASTATLTQPPTVTWEWAGARTPLLVDENADGTRDLIVAVAGASVVGRRADLTDVFSQTVAMGTQDFNSDVLPLSRADNARYVVSLFDRGNGEGHVATLNPSGIAWRSSPIVVAGSGSGDPAVDDLDGDGQDDVIIELQSPLRAYDGATGTQLASGLAIYPTMPIVVRGRAGAITTIGSGSVGSPSGATIDRPATTISTAWSYPAGYQATRLYGSVVQCPTGLVFANARYASPHLIVSDATTGAARYEAIIAGGRLFATDDSVLEARIIPGNPGNVNATVALTSGQPAFLVGSTDGFLYALDACANTPRLLWSLNFRAPVGEPIFADTDGDGVDEIVVEAADGFLYGIDTERFPAPDFVYDTDPAHGVTDADVDETHGSEISALWADVPGATGYEWAVFTAGGTPVTRSPTDPANPFVSASASTHTASQADGLVSGRRYFFAVRAIGPSGASSEMVSDGTTFVREVLPLPDGGTTSDAGTDGGMSMDASVMTDASRDGGTGSAGGCHCRVGRGSMETRSDLRLVALAVAAIAAALGRRKKFPHT